MQAELVQEASDPPLRLTTLLIPSPSHSVLLYSLEHPGTQEPLWSLSMGSPQAQEP